MSVTIAVLGRIIDVGRSTSVSAGRLVGLIASDGDGKGDPYRRQKRGDRRGDKLSFSEISTC